MSSRNLVSLVRQAVRTARTAPSTSRRTVSTVRAAVPHLGAISSSAPALRAACSCRHFTTSTLTKQNDISTAQYEIGDLDVQTYQAVSDRAMDRITEYLEELIEESGELSEGFDVEYSSGVLTLNLGDNGTYVINKQPPNKQIWLSSPLSGPKRYDYDPTHRVWFYARDGSLLRNLLNEELRVLMSNEAVDIDLGEEDELE